MSTWPCAPGRCAHICSNTEHCPLVRWWRAFRSRRIRMPLRLGGNHVDNLYVSIGTDIADPLERLHHIHDVASCLPKTSAPSSGTTSWRGVLTSFPRSCIALAVRTWARTRLANHMRPPVNLVLSNVAGPRQSTARRTGRARGHLLGGSHPRGDRPQHHGLELRRRLARVRSRLPDRVFPIRGRSPMPFTTRWRRSSKPRSAADATLPVGS